MNRLLLAFALVACGGAEVPHDDAPAAAADAPATPAPPQAAAAAPEGHGGGHGGGHGKPKLTDDAAAYHDVLSPLWHADPSPERTANTCAAIPKMAEIAAKMASSTPEHVQAGYAEKSAALVAATEALGKVCGAPERPGFEESFHALHEAFHGVVEQCRD